MVHASILIPICQLGFLIQYYILIAFVIVKNVLMRFVKIMKKQSVQDIIWHPYDFVHPDVFVPSHILIGHERFTFQIYEAETQDHAYVTLWRIRLQDQDKWNNQNPVLIQHGLLDCGMSWFLHEDKNKSLPFVLAEQGYDVWVGNNRGTKYSDKNSHLPKYWEFNLDHFAKYDQPALINKILDETGKNKIVYIGHSQGTTQFFLGLCENEYLQEKIQKFFGMGAVISFENLTTHKLLNFLAKYYIVQILQMIGFKSLLILPKWMHKRVGILTYNFSFYVNIILNFITFLCGKTQRQNIDSARLGILVSHQPGGTSVQSVKHWIQAYRNKKLRKYDYGKSENLKKYGQQTPLSYEFGHLGNLPFRSYIFRGKKDAVISDKDFQNMVGHFNQSQIEVHQIDDYAHLDYAWSISAKQDIYDKIVSILQVEKNTSRQNSTYNTEDTSISSREDFEQMDY